MIYVIDFYSWISEGREYVESTSTQVRRVTWCLQDWGREMDDEVGEV